jgi:molybdate/tungstate transport system substrate-binding protein
MLAVSKAFERLYPDIAVYRESAGSLVSVRKITELGKKADILAVADYNIIPELLYPEFARFYICFARNEIVIAYTSSSKYADEITTSNWYDILLREDVEYGRANPNLDPCGYRTLLVWQLAEEYYNEPQLYQQLLRNCPKANIRPKETDLISITEAGVLDYHFQYISVAKQHKLKIVKLPAEINLSELKYEDLYKKAKITIWGNTPDRKIERQGAPIVYGITIPENADNKDIAIQFLKFLLSGEGMEILEQNYHQPIQPPVGKGNIPEELQELVIL